MDKVRQEIGILIQEVGRVWRTRLDERMRPLGLSQAKWLALWHISRNEGIVQKELALRMGIEGPTLVRLLDRMEADNWLKRSDSKSDRRIRTLHLTDKSRPIIEKVNEIALNLRIDILGGFDDATLAQCHETLQMLRHQLDNV